MQALTDDEQLAEHLARNPPPKGQPVRMADWSPEMEALTLVVDRLGDVVKAVVATIPKARQPQIPPQPRPVTALDRARRKSRSAAHRRLVAKLLPHQQ